MFHATSHFQHITEPQTIHKITTRTSTIQLLFNNLNKPVSKHLKMKQHVVNLFKEWIVVCAYVHQAPGLKHLTLCVCFRHRAADAFAISSRSFSSEGLYTKNMCLPQVKLYRKSKFLLSHIWLFQTGLWNVRTIFLTDSKREKCCHKACAAHDLL